ncbi:leucyl aminopeptidase [Mycobacteroides saopaulense]|uniref:Probable cytosol aminopeptidase n=1 Tax=Mycobacteroides saopaulense TaxID=1578165 RepID=A0ABX3BXG3_9MYCO|nr:leucyl aminopeptidase [Mycobacteroides saopaulense]OHT86605.1 leucyl aminopeptidase [Mycobacteroides saopaulense]OHU08463.1 leucyl aminopeptidase [Mycobacteroides saopaulense]
MSAYTAPSFALATSIPQRGVSAAVLLVGVRPGEKASDKDPKVVDAQLLDKTAVKSIEAALKAVGATGSAEQLTRVVVDGLPVASVLAVGLGKAEGSEAIRRAAGVAARSLDNVENLVTTLSERDVDATVQGLVLGGYRFAEFRSAKTAPKDAGLQKVTLLVGDKGRAQKEAMERGAAVATAVATARDFVNTPPSHLFPAEFAKRAKALATAEGIEIEVLDDKELAKGGYGGIVGVGKGSSRPPRLVRLTYRGAKGKKAKKVALVGKGITFDTGGISIKPAGGMENMTSDMGGAAAVIAVTLLAARQQLPIDVIATVPMAENMPSATAQRPGDVLTHLDGTTVEVINTDAEGRLILADAIVRACQDEPDYLIDTATLTGAQVVALGTRTPGVMGTDEFRDRVSAISQSVGENGWPMPLPEELRDDLKSKVADLANVTNHRNGGMLAAGHYLREFVADGVQWAHIDVAGPAYNTGGPWGYTPKGGTGVPVRTIFGVLEDIAANG